MYRFLRRNLWCPVLFLKNSWCWCFYSFTKSTKGVLRVRIRVIVSVIYFVLLFWISKRNVCFNWSLNIVPSFVKNSNFSAQKLLILSVGGCRLVTVKLHKSQRGSREPELTPVSVAWSNWDYCYSPLDTPQQYVAGTHFYTWVERNNR